VRFSAIAMAIPKDIQKTVGALLIDGAGRVLLGLRASSKKAWPGHWDTIGGRVEPGERLDAALIREAIIRAWRSLRPSGCEGFTERRRAKHDRVSGCATATGIPLLI